MKLSHITIILVALALGLGGGYLVRTQPWQQGGDATIEKGQFDSFHEKLGSRVILYSLSTCPYCKDTRSLLEENGIDFVERVIDKSADAKAEADLLKAKTVPLLLIDQYKVVGYNEEAILDLLQEEQILVQPSLEAG